MILIIGVEGFVGRYLARALKGRKVFGLYYQETADLNELGIGLLQVDIRDSGQVEGAIRRVKPDLIFHLAAQSSAGISFIEPQLTFSVNVHGIFNLLEAARKFSPKVKIMLVSSAEVYGFKKKPLEENDPLSPQSPYAASKAAAEMLALGFGKAYGLQIIRVRPFSHTGPGQSSKFALPSFARQIALIERGLLSPRLKVGNLRVKRDYVDVSDVIAAYLLLAEKGKEGEVYNIASGVAYSLADLLQTLLGNSQKDISVEEDPALLRETDIPYICGDSSKLRLLGWEPKVPMGETLKRLLDWWRENIAR